MDVCIILNIRPTGGQIFNIMQTLTNSYLLVFSLEMERKASYIRRLCK